MHCLYHRSQQLLSNLGCPIIKVIKSTRMHATGKKSEQYRKEKDHIMFCPLEILRVANPPIYAKRIFDTFHRNYLHQAISLAATSNINYYKQLSFFNDSLGDGWCQSKKPYFTIISS